VFGRWNDPYLTMNFSYEATIAGAFLEFMEKGYVYRGRKPVYWCIHDSTALAEAEVEYEDHTSQSVWVKFALVDGENPAEEISAVIWTTTPWTLPHNVLWHFTRTSNTRSSKPRRHPAAGRRSHRGATGRVRHQGSPCAPNLQGPRI